MRQDNFPSAVGAARVGLWIAVALAAGFILGLIAWFAFKGQAAPEDNRDVAAADGKSALYSEDPLDESSAAMSPFALDISPGAASATARSPTPELTVAAQAADVPPGSAIDPFTLGKEPWSDTDFFAYAAVLAEDSALLDALLESFQSETDPARLQRLAMLLAAVGGEGLTEVASDMVYSGNPVSRSAGLELLGYLQPDDADAGSVAVDVLAAESDPAVLVDALNALAVIGAAGPQHHEAVLSQVQTLLEHPSAAVRGQSLSILGRWTDGVDVAPLLEAGLADPVAEVRRAAAYALASRVELSSVAREELLHLAENTEEARQVRTGAAFALQQAQLDSGEASRLEAVLKALSRQ